MNEFHQERISLDVDWLGSKLLPLRIGEPVILTMLNEKGIGKRKNPLITLVPGWKFGLQKRSVVVSVIDNGSCILLLDSDKVTSLINAGMPVGLAKVLLGKLQSTLTNEVYYGNCSTSHPCKDINKRRTRKKPRARTITNTRFKSCTRRGKRTSKK